MAVCRLTEAPRRRRDLAKDLNQSAQRAAQLPPPAPSSRVRVGVWGTQHTAHPPSYRSPRRPHRAHQNCSTSALYQKLPDSVCHACGLQRRRNSARSKPTGERTSCRDEAGVNKPTLPADPRRPHPHHRSRCQGCAVFRHQAQPHNALGPPPRPRDAPPLPDPTDSSSG